MVIRVSFGTLGLPLRLGVGSMGWVVMSDVCQVHVLQQVASCIAG